MTVRIKSDRIITPRGLVSGYVYIEDGLISEVSENELKFDTGYDFTGKYVAPGFIDLHTHGAGGHPFLTDDAHTVAAACDFHLSHGTTSILPTLSASPIAVMESGVRAIKEARDGALTRANIVGAHLEGPYLSPKQCGAQCTDFITEPIREDYVRLIEKYGDAIARWTYAPERDANGEFAKYLTEHGILPSAGHTDATYDDMARAIDAGCKLVTHLYSCTSTVTRNMGFRSLGVIESTFLRDELYAEIIADGRHLPAELVKMIVKIKGADRVALITDSLEIAGTDVTEGVMAGTAFIVEDGVCKLRDRSAFAGSVATADALLRFAVFDCGVDVCHASEMLSATPAEILGINAGKLDTGYSGDIAVLDDGLNISAVFVAGERI